MYRTKLQNLRNAAILYIVITLCVVTSFATSHTMASIIANRAKQRLVYESYSATKNLSQFDKVSVASITNTLLSEPSAQSIQTGVIYAEPVSFTADAKPVVVEEVVSTNVQETVSETVQTAAETTEEPELVMYYTEDDVIIMAKVIQEEAGGIASFAERAAVGWCILNRVDYTGSSYSFPSTIAGCATEPGQFAYYSGTQYTEENYWIAADVLERWNLEQNGFTDVGRTLPSEYLFFSGDGSHNHFRTDIGYGNGSYDWSLGSPYEEDN